MMNYLRFVNWRGGGKKADDSEKLIQSIIEKNLSVVFPGLEFLTTEYQYDDLRPDSIAFDNERKSFVIIEYKNVKHKGVTDQGMSYYNLIQENRGEFVLLYQRIKKKTLDKNGVNWDETRVILISPEFNTHQKRAIHENLPIELYEIKKYENGIIMLDKIQSKKQSKKEKTIQTNPTIRVQGYSTEDYLEGKYGSNFKIKEEIKELFYKLKNRIVECFPDLEIRQNQRYVGFYSSKDGSAICTVVVEANSLKLSYSAYDTGIIHPSSFVRHMVHEDGKKIGHYGLGDFQSEITKEFEIDQAIPLIEKVYNFKVK